MPKKDPRGWRYCAPKDRFGGTATMLPRFIHAGVCLFMLMATGCSFIPDARHRERFHNPLPQLHRVAVLPFFNQSSEPTLNQVAVAEAYYAQLQSIPGFEVLPVGVALAGVESYVGNLAVAGDYRGGQVYMVGGAPTVPFEQIDFSQVSFQQLAEGIGVDAIVVGAVTDYTPYYPPRMALTTRWYAANPGFHPVPAGYGLPWGTKEEKKIPRWVKLEAELELARAQMATQTPGATQASGSSGLPTGEPQGSGRMEYKQNSPDRQLPPPVGVMQAYYADERGAHGRVGEVSPQVGGDLAEESQFEVEPLVVEFPSGNDGSDCGVAGEPLTAPLPSRWPDPSQLIPDAPNPGGPRTPLPQSEPVLSHTRIYRGDDADFTERLAQYVYANDDGRLGGWESYLNRSDDFIRFCCYLHITEMLELRGGRDQSALIFRWPISRYSR